ncbi:MAG: hypothetical protein AB7O49_11495 [Sphingomonadales bacterium]
MLDMELDTTARRLAACVVEGGCDSGEAAPASSKRMQAALAIIDAQLKDAERPLGDDEAASLVPLLMRYRRAAQEGAGDYNLSLLAQAIANIARSGTAAGEFLPLADILAIISPQEMDVVQCLHQYVNDCGMLLRDKTKRSASAERRAIEALVPSVFKSEDEFRAVAAGLLRTGLIEPMILYGNIMYAPSALVDRLDRIVPLGDCPNSRRTA